MLNYLIREKNRVFEISSGAVTQLGFAVHDDVEGNLNPVNNKPLAWYRGAAWVVGSQTEDIKASASLEIINNSILNNFTSFAIDGNSITEGTDWFIASSASSTILSIKNAIDNHATLSTLVNTIQDNSVLYIKSKLAGAGTNFSFTADNLTGIEINSQSSDGSVAFAGGANSGDNFSIFRFNQQTGKFDTVFDENDNEDKPTVANLPKSTGLIIVGDLLYYVYFKHNWDDSKIVIGYRSFSLVTPQKELIVTNKFEREFSGNPSLYFSISDIVDFDGNLFISLVSDSNEQTKIFRIDINNSIFTEIPNLSDHAGRSEAFLIDSGILYSLNSSSSRIGKFNSGTVSFEQTGNTNTLTIDEKFKIGFAKFNNEFYVAYTDPTWQGQLAKTSSLEIVSAWSSVTTIGNPLTYHHFTTLNNSDPVLSDRLFIFNQTSSGTGNFYYYTASGLTLQASVFPVVECAGITPFNASHPDVIIEDIQTNYTGNVTVTYRVYDLERDLVNIRFEYSSDGGSTWSLGSIVSGSQDMGTLTGSGVLLDLNSLENNLSFSSNGGSEHNFDWASLSDLGLGTFNNIRLRLTGFSGAP